MWSIIKSHFHKGKTGFIITGLFVVLSVLMMIVGLSICLGMDNLYSNAREISNSSDFVAHSYDNKPAFDKYLNELLTKYDDKIDKVNKVESFTYVCSTEQLTNYFEFIFGKSGNMRQQGFRALNIDDEKNEFIPRIRNTVEGEGFKVYVTGNFIETTDVTVGATTYFVYNGNRYKGYVAGIYDSMPDIYWSSNYYFDGEFFNMLRDFAKSDEDFMVEDTYNIRFKYKTEKEGAQILMNFDDELRKLCNDFNLVTFDKDKKISYASGNKLTFINATKSFILVLGAAMIAFSVLVALVVAIVMAFLIRSSIMDEVRNLGIWKSIGYTTNMLRLSYLAIYGVICGICMLVGILIGSFLMPTFVNVITAMARLDCSTAISVNVGGIFVAVALVVATICAVVMAATGKIKRITPLSAMRNNLETHSFKRNLAPLAKSKVPVNVGLGLKSVVGEKSRSIMVVVIILIMSFLMSFVSVVFYNLKVDQTAIINMSAIEVPDWVIGFDYDDNTPYFEALRKMDGYVADNMMFSSGCNIDDKYTQGSYYEHFDDLRTDLVYEGRLPKYKNEVLFNVGLAKERGLEIGDSIVLEYSFSAYTDTIKTEMVIVGFFQSIVNTTGYMCFIDSFPEAYEYFGSLSKVPRLWYFEKGKVPNNAEIINYLEQTLGVDKILFRGFYSGRSNIETVFLNSVETASNAVLIVFISVNTIIISLLLVMLIKLKLLRERRNYAICKALGYTTADIMTQISVTMVILGIIGSLVGSIVGALVTTPLLSLAGTIIGVGRFAFVVPYGYTAGIIFAIPILCYIVSMLCAIPVRKIAPATLLRERG